MLVAKASDERPQQDKAAVAASKRENNSFLISKFFVADCTIMLPFSLYWLSGFCKMPICFCARTNTWLAEADALPRISHKPSHRQRHGCSWPRYKRLLNALQNHDVKCHNCHSGSGLLILPNLKLRPQ
jgi:hypothetical protein